MGTGSADEAIRSPNPTSGDSDTRTPVALDPDSRRWVQRLRAGHPRHDQALGSLHDLLRRVARHELSRRRQRVWSISGPALDDLAEQAADDALVNILRKLVDRVEAIGGTIRVDSRLGVGTAVQVKLQSTRSRWSLSAQVPVCALRERPDV